MKYLVVCIALFIYCIEALPPSGPPPSGPPPPGPPPPGPPPPGPPHGSTPSRPPSTTNKLTTISQNGPTTSSSVTSSLLTDPSIVYWIKTTGNGYGGIPDNVLSCQYSTSYVYIKTNSVPSYSIGPWNNPNTPSAENRYYKISRNPVVSSSKTSTGLGAYGVLKNGVALYNPSDAQSYNNQGIWNRNAYYNELSSFDKCNGHPSPFGEYHNHINPICLYNSTDSKKHSPLLGFLFDGFPIYGSFGYSSANDSSSTIKRLLPSYSFRNITKRQTLPNGTQLSQSQYGPDVNTTYPIGNYLEDYQYVAHLGDLDQYNGRFCVTPEYPKGIYAYFVATNSNNYPVYPYLSGPQYYGTFINQMGQGAPTESVTNCPNF